MVRIEPQDIIRYVTVALVSLLVWFAQGIYRGQEDIACRLRVVELNQARIMERIGVDRLRNPSDLSVP